MSINNKIEDISSIELKKLIDNNQNVLIIDVRLVQEYAEGHIEGSLNLVLDVLNNSMVEKAVENHLKTINKNSPLHVIFQCRSGVRSLMALGKIVMDSPVYDDVKFFNLKDGILGWVANSYPVK
jgi:rhodanese-related sulfurtransferase